MKYYENTQNNQYYISGTKQMIYFGKKIPLFHLERMSKNRIRFNLIKKLRNFEALSKLTNWHSSYLKENNIGLTNYLSDYLGNLDNKIVKISNPIKKK